MQKIQITRGDDKISMVQTVLLIGEDGVKIGNISFEEAKGIARDKNKDLMLVNKDKRVYKIGDEGKLKYDKKRNKRKSKSQQKSQKIKEIQIRPTIEDGDLEIKLRRIREFLSDGLKTKLVMKFKRQQMVYKESGICKVNSIIDKLVSEGIATVTAKPKLDGRNITIFLIPIKE